MQQLEQGTVVQIPFPDNPEIKLPFVVSELFWHPSRRTGSNVNTFDCQLTLEPQANYEARMERQRMQAEKDAELGKRVASLFVKTEPPRRSTLDRFFKWLGLYR